MLKNNYLIINAQSDIASYGLAVVSVCSDKTVHLSLVDTVHPKDIVSRVLSAPKVDLIEVIGGGDLVFLLRAVIGHTPIEDLNVPSFVNVFAENLAHLMRCGVFKTDLKDSDAWRAEVLRYIPDSAGAKCVMLETATAIVPILRRDGWPNEDNEMWGDRESRLRSEMMGIDSNSRDAWVSMEKERYDKKEDNVFSALCQ